MNKHIMVDLEFLAHTPNGVVVAIGAVKFDPEKPIETWQSFYTCIDWHKYDPVFFECDDETLLWWDNQSEKVKQQLDGTVHPVSATLDFQKFAKDVEFFWSNHPVADEAKLIYMANKLLKQQPSWSYRASSDFYTMYKIYEDVVWDQMDDETDMHNALNDAMHAAKHVAKIVSVKGLSALGRRNK